MLSSIGLLQFTKKRSNKEFKSERRKDFKKQLLNIAMEPLEIISGRDLYDPRMLSEAGKKADKTADIITGTLAGALPAAANMVVPGSGNIINAGRTVTNAVVPQTNLNNDEGAFDSGMGIGNALGQFAGSLNTPLPEAKYGMKNFKSGAAYKKWLAYGHMSGEFARTPGNQKISIQGEPHMVKHEDGGPAYEAEGDEMIMGGVPTIYSGGKVEAKASNMFKLKGNSHEQGGMPAKGGKYIFSDSLQLDDTFLKGI